jgi:hypothetical protein
LRAAHFLALHAIQVLPVAALLLPSPRWVRALAVLWLGASGWLFVQALAGYPVWPR